MKVGDVIATFKSDLKNFKSGLKTAKSSVSSFSEKTTQSLKSVRNGALIVTGALTGVAIASMKLGTVAGKYESVRDAFGSMTKGMGIDINKFEKDVASASRGTIDKLTILQGGTRALSLIGRDAFSDFGSQFAQMAELSKKSARATGQEVDFMFDSLITGMSRESKMILDNLGITVDLTQAKKDYAAELGKGVDELTLTESKTAVLNHTLGKLEENYGEVAASSGGFSGAMSTMKTTIKDAQIEIGTALLPILNEIIRTLTPLIKDHLPKFIEGVKKGVKWLKELSPVGKKVVAFLVLLAPIIAIVSGALVFIIPMIGSLITAIGFLVSPIGLVIAAIGVFIVMMISMYKNLKRSIEAWKGIVNTIKTAIQIIIDIFKGFDPGALMDDEMWAKWRRFVEVLENVRKAITGFYELIFKGDYKRRLYDSLGLAEDSPVVLGILGFRDKIKSVADSVAKAIRFLIDGVIKPYINKWIAIFQRIADFFGWWWYNLIEPILLLVQAVILRVLVTIKDFFIQIFTAIFTWLKDNFFTPVYNFVVKWFNEILNWIKTKLEWLRDLFMQIWTFIKDEIIVPILTAVSNFIKERWENIKRNTQIVWNWIKEHIVKPLTDAWGRVVEVVNKIVSFIENTWNRIKDYLIEMKNKIYNAIVEPFKKAKEKIEEIANKIREAAERINPLHRESPSLVENVRAGVKAIQDAYAKLGMSIQPPNLIGVTNARGGNTVIVQMAGAYITDMEVAEDYAEKIGDQVIRKLSRVAKTM